MTKDPCEARKRSGLKPDDPMVEIGGDVVRLEPSDLDYLRAVQRVLLEWESPEDAAAYDDL